MAEKKQVKVEELQRPSVEMLYSDEIARLIENDKGKPKPLGWAMTPDSVVKFVLGDKKLDIVHKFVGTRRFIERCVVALATNRGLMLIGEPGTAKSYLSEILSAAISGDSTLIVQGSAGTTEDDIKYSWNYALLLSEGATPSAMVEAPLYRGMDEGKLVRFEEITRCPLEIQDTLLSILSDRVMKIPEFNGPEGTLYARSGFNVIATANTRDRGVNEMSAALKRRFNFETVHPIQNLKQERELVQTQMERRLERAGIPVRFTEDATELLVTTFHELRSGKTLGGQAIETLTTVMSTAEAVEVGYASSLHAYYFGKSSVQPDHIVDNIVGAALKENAEDLKKLRLYFNQVVKGRKGKHWQSYYEASRKVLNQS
ncbi:MAG: AAA family ATPase [Myxococcota bacterium]|jgi:MoxR-like ATPase|nr:AAA family ATPase [Myxococcota bacterium]